MSLGTLSAPYAELKWAPALKGATVLDPNNPRDEIVDSETIQEDGEELDKITYKNGTVIYLDVKSLELHRTGAPAYLYPDGKEVWLHYGKRHRLDGPSSLDPKKQEVEFYLDDKKLSPEEIYCFGKLQNCPIDEVPLYVRYDNLNALIKKRLKEVGNEI